jgi:hypothetical protein
VGFWPRITQKWSKMTQKPYFSYVQKYPIVPTSLEKSSKITPFYFIILKGKPPKIRKILPYLCTHKNQKALKNAYLCTHKNIKTAKN